jgi:hypothetical protein
MNFTTQVPLLNSSAPINHDSKMMSLGSCFAVNMGEKFDYYKFQNRTNPFGIIFNPVSIDVLVQRAVHKNYFTAQDLFFYNDLWHCYQVHSDLSTPDKDVLLQHLNAVLDDLYVQMGAMSHVLITYGTSWVYRNKAHDAIVANCHKVPQKEFEKEILSVDAVSHAIQNTVEAIRTINPNCNILFTVSPVRHLKDGFVENQRSKAHLIAAIHNQSDIEYFPSYEIMMDELRDYRFYAQDMIHPSAVAIDYIWERFVATHVAAESHAIMDEVASIQKGLAHRPFNPETESHQRFLENLNKKINTLTSNYPQIQF